ncbi:cytosolic beta-glucosidase-like [Convolutriloba macropyga]|uniref:cytosolic beta-glucosidase-like n=1 Tax=Convolutriloba macropyga TaxID=536237 RepID=UPI003F525CF5
MRRKWTDNNQLALKVGDVMWALEDLAPRGNWYLGRVAETSPGRDASAAYNIEGGWDADGKGESTLDHVNHSPSHQGEPTGDDADKSYYFWEEDVNNLKNMGVDFYRFSFSWSRIAPNGTIENPDSDINPMGVKYYNSIIDALILAGIEPLVTLFNFDLPQTLQGISLSFPNLGGLTSSKMPSWFEKYADFCFNTFGDRVKLWTTINDPYYNSACYETGCVGVEDPGVSAYLREHFHFLICMHQQLLSHARAWHLYNDKYRSTQGGKVGINVGSSWPEPYNQSQLNIDTTEKVLQFQLGWVLSPLLGNGEYPDVMKNVIGELSEFQGFLQSRLPEELFLHCEVIRRLVTKATLKEAASDAVDLGSVVRKGNESIVHATNEKLFDTLMKQKFAPDESRLLLGSVDFLGFNYFGSIMAQYTYQQYSKQPSMASDQSFITVFPDWWLSYGLKMNRIFPQGVRKSVSWMMESYVKDYPIEIFITENGYPGLETNCSKNSGSEKDRMKYLVAHLDQVHRAAGHDLFPVTRYSYWGLMDMYSNGYDVKFGLYCVDYSSLNRTRTARESANVYKQLIYEHGVVSLEFEQKLRDWGVLEPLE